MDKFIKKLEAWLAKRTKSEPQYLKGKSKK